MRVIKRKSDVDLLARVNGISPGLATHLKEYLDSLQSQLEEMEPNTYEVAKDVGYIVILEPGDNVMDLDYIGLNPADKGLLGCIPEWIEQATFDGQVYYRICVLLGDSFGLTIYSRKGSLEQEIEQWFHYAINTWGDDCNV